MIEKKLNYFKNISSKIKDVISSDSTTCHKNSKPLLLPMQYMYIHNLQTGELESVRGVDKVLGYHNKDFTLEFYYRKLHPDDLEIVFETSKRSIEWVIDQGCLIPNELQMSIINRIKRCNGDYAKILRQSIVWESSKTTVLKTLSICSDVTVLGINATKPASIHLPLNLSSNKFNLLNPKIEKQFSILTTREKEIIFLIAEGFTSAEIGGKLHLSKHTIDTHRRKILFKTKMKSMNELTVKLINSDVI